MKLTTKIQVVVSIISSATIFNVSANTIPSWVLNPSNEGGLAAVDCVEFSGNMSVDAKLASANARLALSKQIGTQIQGVDETFDERQVSDAGTQILSKFSSVSTQITKQSISGSKISRSDVVEIQGKSYFCSMALLDSTKTQKLFDNMVKQSDVELTPDLKNDLYQEFTAQKTLPKSSQVESLIDEG